MAKPSVLRVPPTAKGNTQGGWVEEALPTRVLGNPLGTMSASMTPRGGGAMVLMAKVASSTEKRRVDFALLSQELWASRSRCRSQLPRSLLGQLDLRQVTEREQDLRMPQARG